MFPVLLAATAERVGADRAGQVSGWQLLAGNAGATTFPALTGLVVALTGPAAPAAVLVCMAATGAALIVRAGRGHTPAVDVRRANHEPD
jgi:hypothetical protein